MSGGSLTAPYKGGVVWDCK